MSSEYAEIKRLEREIEQARIAAERLEDLNKQLEAEIGRASEINKQFETKVSQLEAENKRLEAESSALRRTIAEAKDPSPVKRCSFKRVMALASAACLSLQRLRSGWLLKLGHLERRFRSLGQIWQILIQEDWALSDVFPPSPTAQRPRLSERHPVLAGVHP